MEKVCSLYSLYEQHMTEEDEELERKQKFGGHLKKLKKKKKIIRTKWQTVSTTGGARPELRLFHYKCSDLFQIKCDHGQVGPLDAQNAL